MDFSLPRPFAPWNIRTLELLLPGTFQANGGWSESTQPRAKVDDMLSHFHMILDGCVRLALMATQLGIRQNNGKNTCRSRCVTSLTHSLLRLTS